MTRLQMEAAKKTLPRLTEWKTWTEEQRRLSKELDCRSMINSCLCYGGIADFWRECEWRFGQDKSYAAPHIRELGLARVKELVAEQERDFAAAKLYRDVFTDSEGVTYNSIVWADEFEKEKTA